MSKVKQGKLRLLQGASAILVISGGIAGAQAQTQVSSTITETGTDGVIASDQSTTGNVTATASGTSNESTVGAVTSGSINGGGTSGTIALGNLDTLTFTDSGSAINGTSDAMIALQDSTGTSDTNILIKADTLNTTNGLEAKVDTTAQAVTSSSLSVNGASDTASATANSATQTMTLSATELTLGTANATADSVLNGTALDLDATGKAVAASLQSNSFADVDANTTGSTIQLTAGATTDSSLSVSTNVQSATAAGSTATNGITVSGTSLGIGVVIASQQVNDADSSVEADAAGSATLSATSLDGSTATMSGNRLQSQATGGQTSNTLTATATNVSLAEADATADATETDPAVPAPAVISGGAGTVSAAFVTLNDQEINGSVSSITTTEATTSAMKIGIGGGATDSTITNDSNVVSAKAQGALTTNQTTLTVGATLDTAGTDATGGIANGATVANVQNVGADADITATVKTDSATKDMILTDVDEALTRSTLSTSSNRITATAESTNATNSLTVSATDIAVSAEATATPYVAATSSTAGTADAAFSVANVQKSLANDVTATAGEKATVYTVVDGTVAGGAIVDSTVNSNTNTISSLATGNKAANTVSLAGTSVGADAGVLNVQSSASIVKAEVGKSGDAGVYVEANDDITGSAISLNGNIVQGGAVSNSAANQLTVTATTLDSGTVQSGVATATNSTARGQADYAVANLQTVIGTTTSDVDSVINFDQTTGKDLQNSKLSIANNIQLSEALGSSASNGITVSATTVEAGVAIASQQVSEATGTVTANNAGSVTMSVAELDGSSALLTGNRLQSQANGLQTANTLTVTATNVNLSPINDTDTAVVTAGSAGTATANFALVNDQDVGATVSATTTTQSAEAAMKIAVSGAVLDSALANDSNIVSARAQGAAATNLSTLTIGSTLATTGTGTATTGEIANAASLANVQTISNAANVTATVTTTGASNLDTILTDLGSTLTNSAITASSNRITATAEGANATNTLAVSATDISVAAETSGVPVVESDITGEETANAAFSLLNSQASGTGSVTATTGDKATVYTVVDGAMDNSSITSNANAISGFATSNKAANTVSLTGTTVAGDAGLLNAQTSRSDVSTIIGDTAQAGVFVESNAAITDSAIAVTNNVVQGSAVNNSVNNQLTVAATTLDGDGSTAKAFATGTPTTADDAASVKAQADYSLANLQTVDSSASTVSDIDATFGIDQTSGSLMQDSRLSVSNNTQFGEALANSATNRMTLNATDAGAGIVPTAALSNTQEAAFTKEATNGTDNNDVSSTSDMNVYVSAASMGSSIAANGNANTALAVMNNAGNTLSATGTNLAGTAGLATIDAGVSATADVALNNYQTATGNLASTATTSLYNFDEAATTTAAGTLDSSVSFANNTTMSEASANRVANALTVSGTAEVGATAALNNTQVSDTVVGATATTTLEYTMSAGTRLFDQTVTDGSADVYAAESSSIVVDGNSTTAMARGNTANNTLNYAAGASYAGVTGTPIINSGGTDLSAGAALMNNQSNLGNVTATAQTVTYTLNLDGDATTIAAGTDPVTPAVNFEGALNSNVSLVNNTTAAAAYGNSAVNTLAMGTFGSGIPSSGLSSLQSNSGAVVAQATNVGYNLTITGQATGTAVRNTGNVVTAQAVGNSSISSITGGN